MNYATYFLNGLLYSSAVFHPEKGEKPSYNSSQSVWDLNWLMENDIMMDLKYKRLAIIMLFRGIDDFSELFD